MLERKVVVYSKQPSIVSSFIFSLLSLIPGILAFGRRNCNKVMLYLKSEEMYGLPFQVFNENSGLYLFCPVSELQDVKSYVLGTSDMVLLHTSEVKADAYINIDSKVFELKNKELSYLLNLSEYEKNFTKTILKSVSELKENNNWSCIEGVVEEGIDQYIGSNDYIRREFAEYYYQFIIMLSVSELICGTIDETKNEEELKAGRKRIHEVYYNITGNHYKDDIKYEEEKKSVKEKREMSSKEISIRTEMIEQILENYNLKFIRNWQQAINYSLWKVNHSPLLFSFSDFSSTLSYHHRCGSEDGDKL